MSPAPSLREGTLLVSNPTLMDPNFDATVVLLCAYSEEGAFGLVLNRPLETPLSEILPPPVPPALAELKASWGGPVGTDQMHILHKGVPESEETVSLPGGWVLGADFPQAQNLAEKGIPLRFFLGYAGWEGGQLDTEMEEDSWKLLLEEESKALGQSPAQLWERMLGRADPDWSWLKHTPTEPERN